MFRPNVGLRYSHPYNSKNAEKNKALEILKRFRSFKPLLKRRLLNIKAEGREKQLQEEVDDTMFYLKVMEDVMAVENHGVDTVQRFMDNIHELIRKRPDNVQSGCSESGSNEDYPRSPSPEQIYDSPAPTVIPTESSHETFYDSVGTEPNNFQSPLWPNPIHNPNYGAGPFQSLRDTDFRCVGRGMPLNNYEKPPLRGSSINLFLSNENDGAMDTDHRFNNQFSDRRDPDFQRADEWRENTRLGVNRSKDNFRSNGRSFNEPRIPVNLNHADPFSIRRPDHPRNRFEGPTGREFFNQSRMDSQGVRNNVDPFDHDEMHDYNHGEEEMNQSLAAQDLDLRKNPLQPPNPAYVNPDVRTMQPQMFRGPQMSTHSVRGYRHSAPNNIRPFNVPYGARNPGRMPSPPIMGLQNGIGSRNVPNNNARMPIAPHSGRGSYRPFTPQRSPLLPTPSSFHQPRHPRPNNDNFNPQNSSDDLKSISRQKAEQCFSRAPPRRDQFPVPRNSPPYVGRASGSKDMRFRSLRPMLRDSSSPVLTNSDEERQFYRPNEEIHSSQRHDRIAHYDNRRSSELEQTKERVRARIPIRKVDKISKIQDFRKQLEKEQPIRLGRPSKQTSANSNEDMNSVRNSTDPSDPQRDSNVDKRSDDTSNNSSKSSYIEDKEDERYKRNRKSSDRKERERSQKRVRRRSDSTNRIHTKEKSKNNSKSSEKPKAAEPVEPITLLGTSTSASKTKFRIPKIKKPASSPLPSPPPEEETETHPVLDLVPVSEASPKSQDIVDSSSDKETKSKANKSDPSSQVPHLEPDEFIKKFINAENPDKLLQDPTSIIRLQSFLKNFNESTKPNSSGADQDLEEEHQESITEDSNSEVVEATDRSRSRTRKGKTKRKKSLEKLQDALKEMEFDKIMPLGPRRRAKQGDEASSDTTSVISDPSSSNIDSSTTAADIGEMSLSNDVSVDLDKDSERIENPRPPGRPPGKKRGRKRKRKVSIVSSKKKGKKNGPVTRAQVVLSKAVLKANKKAMEEEIKSNESPNSCDGKETKALKKKTKTDERRITRSVAKNKLQGIAVNQGLAKVKLECDYIPPTKLEPVEYDPFLDSNENLEVDLNDLPVPSPTIFNVEALREQENLPVISEADIRKEILNIEQQSHTDDITSSEPFVDDASMKLDTDLEESLDETSMLNDKTEDIIKPEDISVVNTIDLVPESSDGPPPAKRRKRKIYGFECTQCSFTGKKIVWHYVNSHPNSFIPEARLDESTYERLLSANESNSKQLLEINLSHAEDNKVWPCLYCDDRYERVTEYFEHLTAHTGEFMYACNCCRMQYALYKTAANHIKTHKNKDGVTGDVSQHLIRMYEPPVVGSELELVGYLCQDCRYFQLSLSSLLAHLCEMKHSQNNGIRIRLVIPKPEAKSSDGAESPTLPEIESEQYDESVFVGADDPILSCMKVESDPLYSSGMSETLESLNSILKSHEELEKNVLTYKSLKTTEEIENEEIEAICLDTLDWMVTCIEYKTESSPKRMAEDVERLDRLFDAVPSKLKASDDNDPADPNVKIEVTSDDHSVYDYFGSYDCLEYDEISDLPAIKIEPEEHSCIKTEISDSESSSAVIVGLSGQELLRCGSAPCSFSTSSYHDFKDHVQGCHFNTDPREYPCYHCEKRCKSLQTLLEHLKTHGVPKQICGLCDFKCCSVSELVKHVKAHHRVYNHKIRKFTNEESDPSWIIFPKEIIPKISTASSLLQSQFLFTSKLEFGPKDLEQIPKSSIFSSIIHCKLCPYGTKVRSNFLRHLNLHVNAADTDLKNVPISSPVNPVPCLERNELMFDKMTNWAGSSHTNKPSVAASESAKLPQYVQEQFRFMCSVPECKQITVDDAMLRTHMKALHFDVTLYKCPHCQENEFGKNDPRNTVCIDKISTHLKFHGPRLFRCGHCDYIHTQARVIEKHVSERHPERKPFHYQIRNLEGDPNGARRSSTDEGSKQCEKWRCALCANKTVLGSWEEARLHCHTLHRTMHQFHCSICRFGSDSIQDIAHHISPGVCKFAIKGANASVFVMFFRNELIEASESNLPVWRRNSSYVKHIRGIFLEEAKTKEMKTESIIASNPQMQSDASQPVGAIEPIQSLKTSASKPSNVKGSQNSKLTPTKWVKPNGAGGKSPSKLKVVPGKTVGSGEKPMLVCPRCQRFKTQSYQDMTIHLYNEYHYKRFQCNLCVLKFVSESSLKGHLISDHAVEYDTSMIKTLPVDERLEDSVQKSINSQYITIRETENGKEEVTIVCKHCGVSFSTYHNFRTHVLARHIASSRYMCRYCSSGFYTEGMLKAHHLRSHAALVYDCIVNEEVEEKLTPEFWEKEYGIPSAKSCVKSKVVSVSNSSSDEDKYKCPVCVFTSEGLAKTLEHIKTHVHAVDCPMCWRKFRTTFDCRFHIRYDHGQGSLGPKVHPRRAKEYESLKKQIVVLQEEQDSNAKEAPKKVQKGTFKGNAFDERLRRMEELEMNDK